MVAKLPIPYDLWLWPHTPISPLLKWVIGCLGIAYCIKCESTSMRFRPVWNLRETSFEALLRTLNTRQQRAPQHRDCTLHSLLLNQAGPPPVIMSVRPLTVSTTTWQLHFSFELRHKSDFNEFYFQNKNISKCNRSSQTRLGQNITITGFQTQHDV